MKSVKIVGKRYAIEKISHLDDCGHTDPPKCVIRLSDDLDDQQEKDTLLHEIIHGISFEMHLKMKERQVHCMATALLLLFKENPKLAEYLEI